MKHCLLATLAMMTICLLVVPTANAQINFGSTEPEPREGWLIHQLNNTTRNMEAIQVNLEQNMCDHDVISNRNRYSSWCGQLSDRLYSGQIDRMNYEAARADYFAGIANRETGRMIPGVNAFGQHSFSFGRVGGNIFFGNGPMGYGRYGHFGGNPYFWDGRQWKAIGEAFKQLKTPLIVGIGASAGVAVVDRVFDKLEDEDDHKTVRRDQDINREAMYLEHDVHPLQQQARQQAAQTEQAPSQDAPPVAQQQSNQPPPSVEPYTGPITVRNWTGCDLVFKVGSVRHPLGPKESAAVAGLGSNVDIGIVNGTCADGPTVLLNQKGDIATIYCGNPFK